MTTRKIFVVSDTHFNHTNIIKYCNRPFSSVKEMDECLIENWNETVRDQDIVYHLGDVYFGTEGRVVNKLKGRKRLVLGNHDNGLDDHLRRHFQKISVWRMFPEFGLLLTHVPVHESALEAKKLVNVHGHIHDNTSPSGPYKCVCVEQTNYKPVDIEKLRVV